MVRVFRRHRGLTGIVLLVGCALYWGGSGSPPAAAIGAASTPVAKPARAATATQVAGAPRVETWMGDAALAGALDLSRARLRGDRYEISLGDGRRAVLTLDPTIQRAAEAVLARAKSEMGAVVVMATDGRILALAGRRDVEPTRERDFELPLAVWAPAASVFKVVTSAALVDAGVRPDQRVCFHGGVRSVVASNLRDDARLDSRCEDLTYGLARSQNAIFAKLAHRHLRPARLRQLAERFGFGWKPPLALPALTGRAEIPEDDDLAFARVSAGFWHTELSPLGGAIVANVVASGGKRVPPRVVERVVADDGTEIVVEPAPGTRVIREKVARQVAAMMTETTTSGTAQRGFHDIEGRPFFADIDIAGKTGTLTRSDPSYLEYSWFVGFAPADQPQVSISVLLGNPPRWTLKAHTAARIVLQDAL